jgi:tRNA A-37 threonylcarbamoyl transferase component Bud32
MIPVICTNCGLRILVPPTVQGKIGLCFNCRQPLLVPGAPPPVRRSLDYGPSDRISERYVIETQIGKGGMGVVYRAHDTLVEETVALKFMNPELLRTERGQQLFIREAQIARRLRHENIVAVHDVSWTQDGILYLSMEYAEGQSLRNYLRRYRTERRYVDVRVAVAFLRQILAALEFAHRTVIHRDIKPENVMILSGERVKVLDFGLAKVAHEELLQGQPGGPASPRGIIGTLAYAAPEQRRGQTTDLRADVYAVGLLMHELLTLRTPMDDPVTVTKVRNDVSPSLLAILAKALAEGKEQRWQSAREFRIALEQAFEESYRKPVDHIAVPDRIEPASTAGMVFLEGGSFLMGSNDVREEAPEEEVYVAPFWMDIYPVTVAQYGAYLEATGGPEPRYWRDPQYNGPNQPIVGGSLRLRRLAGQVAPDRNPVGIRRARQGKPQIPVGTSAPGPESLQFRRLPRHALDCHHARRWAFARRAVRPCGQRDGMDSRLVPPLLGPAPQSQRHGQPPVAGVAGRLLEFPRRRTHLHRAQRPLPRDPRQYRRVPLRPPREQRLRCPNTACVFEDCWRSMAVSACLPL